MNKLFQSLWARYSRDSIEGPSLARWGHVLASIVVAAGTANLCYRICNFPQTYSEPIVGNITWSVATKFRDYAVLYSFVVGFFLCLVAISALSGRLSRRFGPEVGSRFHDLLLLFCAPAGLWFAGLLTTLSRSLWLLELSGALVVTALVICVVLNMRSEGFWDGGAAQVTRLIRLIVLLTGVSPLAVAAIAVGYNRITIVATGTSWLSAHQVDRAVAVTAAVFLIAAMALALRSPSARRTEQLLVRAGFCFQLAFPVFFLLLIPTPRLSGERAVIGHSLTRLAWGVVPACMLAAYLDLFRRHRRSRLLSAADSGPRVSSVCVVGVLLFFKASVVGAPYVSPDDYHFGEVLVPWWSLARHHLVPFWDYMPARGLVNYLPGAINSLFLDGKAASFPAVFPFLAVGILGVALPVLRRTVGIAVASVALLIAPCANFVSEIDVMVTVFVCVLAHGLTAGKPVRWIAVWILLGTALVLFAPGQGGLAIVATAPLAALPLARAFEEQRRRLLTVLGALAGGLVLASLFSPLGKMIYGAVRYGVEQSSANSVAHGINWDSGFGASGVNPWLFELMRASFLLVGLWAGSVLWQARSGRFAAVRGAILAYAVPIALLVILFVVRAAGRIDGGPSRLGLASIWMLSLLLPLLVFGPARVASTGCAVLVWLSLVGIVHPHYDDLGTDYARVFNPILVAPAVDGASMGIPGMGAGVIDRRQLARLAAIRKVLDTVLDPNETYLDLSGRHAEYFYFDRRPPIETAAIYNLVTESGHLRAISALKKERPPAILIRSDNLTHDGGPISLRAHLVYRYILLQDGYKVVKIGDSVWLIREDRIARASGLGVSSVSEIGDEPTNPANEAFRAGDLAGIPASWGRSFGTLEPKMRLVKALPPTARRDLGSVAPLDNGHYRPTGDDPFVRADISDWHLRGRDAGILSFDFYCQRVGQKPPILEVYWATATNPEGERTVVRFRGENGHLIAPMDAAPSWLLASELKSIRFDVADGKSCSEFGISNVKLLQRHGAD